MERGAATAGEGFPAPQFRSIVLRRGGAHIRRRQWYRRRNRYEQLRRWRRYAGPGKLDCRHHGVVGFPASVSTEGIALQAPVAPSGGAQLLALFR
jgi:hypothetical protein